MGETATATPLRYRGTNSKYVDIASRKDERLGLSVQYAVHPQTMVGCFVLRFIVHGKGIDPKNYKHLTYRESAKFFVPETETTSAEVFKGVRLNKIAIEVFKPAAYKWDVGAFGDKYDVWAKVAAWVTAQVVAEGFTMTLPDLAAEVRTQVALPTTNPDTIESVLTFPDLSAPEEQAAALKLVKKPEPEEEEEEEEDDEDDEDDVKDWLN